VFGSSNPYAQPGETQLTVSTRNLRSTDHYNRDVEQLQRQTLGSYVLNTQHAFDFNVTHVFTERFSMSLAFLHRRLVGSEPHHCGPSARANQRQTASATFHIRPNVDLPDQSPGRQPRSGRRHQGTDRRYRATDVFPGINGTNPKEKPVDRRSPGDAAGA
jgi:hypothetical protein